MLNSSTGWDLLLTGAQWPMGIRDITDHKIVDNSYSGFVAEGLGFGLALEWFQGGKLSFIQFRILLHRPGACNQIDNTLSQMQILGGQRCEKFISSQHKLHLMQILILSKR